MSLDVRVGDWVIISMRDYQFHIGCIEQIVDRETVLVQVSKKKREHSVLRHIDNVWAVLEVSHKEQP